VIIESVSGTSGSVSNDCVLSETLISEGGLTVFPPPGTPTSAASPPPQQGCTPDQQCSPQQDGHVNLDAKLAAVDTCVSANVTRLICPTAHPIFAATAVCTF